MIKKIIKYSSNLIDIYRHDILIYQMGKVGSTTIEKALKEHGLNVWHGHVILGLDFYKSDRSLMYKKMSSKIKRFIAKNIRKRMFSNENKQKIITLVRDPIARHYSFFFQALYILLYEHNKKDNRKEESLLEMLKAIADERIDFKFHENWFKYEINELIGCDVTSFSFDCDLGYGVIETQDAEILVMTCESINRNNDIISEFCGLDTKLKLVNSNKASDKWYTSWYNQFKGELFDDAKISEVYKSSFMSHFYTSSDINSFKSKWLAKK